MRLTYLLTIFNSEPESSFKFSIMYSLKYRLISVRFNNIKLKSFSDQKSTNL